MTGTRPPARQMVPPALVSGAEYVRCPLDNRIARNDGQLGSKLDGLKATPSAPPPSAGTQGEWKCS